jgi:hypothetical protein
VGADGEMDVHLDVSTTGYAGRLEVLEGPTGRRVRSEADKARIAAESLMPGVQVCRRSHASMADALAGLRFGGVAFVREYWYCRKGLRRCSRR